MDPGTDMKTHVDTRDLHIVTGVNGDDQMGSFQNATLQSTPDYKLDYSISTHVDIPPDIARRGEEAVANHLAFVLGDRLGDGVRFRVQVGPFGGNSNA